jgi:hypothetical protein
MSDSPADFVLGLAVGAGCTFLLLVIFGAAITRTPRIENVVHDNHTWIVYKFRRGVSLIHHPDCTHNEQEIN